MRGTTYFIPASLPCSQRTAGPLEPVLAYGRTMFTRSVFARSVPTAGVALCETLIASEPAIFEPTLTVATPAAPPSTALNRSDLARIFFLPR